MFDEVSVGLRVFDEVSELADCVCDTLADGGLDLVAVCELVVDPAP